MSSAPGDVMKPIILITRIVPEEPLAPLYELGEVKIWDGPSVMPRERLLEEISEATALFCVAVRVDEELLSRAPRLKVVSNFGVGYDNIDIEAATARKIIVTNAPDVVTGATADLTAALILCAARRIVEAANYTRERRWRGWDADLMRGNDVHGKTLGLIGLGRIGRAVARRMLGFDMKVVYYDVRRDVDIENRLGISYVNFHEVFRVSDFVSVHVPLSPETRKLIGAREFSLMKPGAYFINAARGGVVDYDALREALENRTIAGAAVDVMPNEPPSPDDPLLGLPNLLVTPHIGTATIETRRAMTAVVVRNIVAVLKGEAPPNWVNKDRF